MSKKIITLILTAALCLALAGTAFAADGWDDPIKGRDDLHVTYKADGTWDSSLGSTWDDLFQSDTVKGGIQPGDTIQITVALNNEHDGENAWYLENKVLQTLEETQKASNGAYTYKLTYTNPAGETRNLKDVVVGGSEQTGMKDATEGIADEPVYLDTFKKGDKGSVTLEIKLDGESQGNAYQLTQGQLQLLFGVEQLGTTTPPKSNTPNTGDRSNALPYMIAMFAAGVAILVVAIVMVSRRRRDGKAGE